MERIMTCLNLAPFYDLVGDRVFECHKRHAVLKKKAVKIELVRHKVPSKYCARGLKGAEAPHLYHKHTDV